jgi:membrane protein DedA with SNARE-associated domain
VFAILGKHEALLILGFRFIYGFRTVTPFLIGTSEISPARFFVFNCIGASIWATVIGFGGYVFGHVLELIIGDLKKYEVAIFLILLACGLLLWLVHFIRTHLANKALRRTSR